MGNYVSKSKKVYIVKVPKVFISKYANATHMKSEEDKYGLMSVKYLTNEEKEKEEGYTRNHVYGYIKGYEEHYIRFAYGLIKSNISRINYYSPFNSKNKVFNNEKYFNFYSTLDTCVDYINKDDMRTVMMYVYYILRLRNIVNEDIGILYFSDLSKNNKINYALYKYKNKYYKNYVCSEERLNEVLEKIYNEEHGHTLEMIKEEEVNNEEEIKYPQIN